MYNYLRTKRLQFTSLQNIQFNTTNFNYKVTGYKIPGFTKANNLGILQQCDIIIVCSIILKSDNN